MLPDGLHVTTRMVADYFEVGEEAVKSVAKRHREELRSNGMRTLRGADLQFFERANMDLSQASYPQGRAHLTLYTRRAILNVAMLLRDSEVARRVRTYLLDTEEALRPQEAAPSAGYVSLEKLVTDTAAKAAERILEGPTGTRLSAVEACLGDVGSSLRELGPVIAGITVRLERIDHRLDATNHVVCAMSERLCDLSEDMKEVRQDVAVLSRDVTELKGRPSRAPRRHRSGT
jgi:hypothetical protein